MALLLDIYPFLSGWLITSSVKLLQFSIIYVFLPEYHFYLKSTIFRIDAETFYPKNI